MAFKRMVIDGYGQIELNNVAFRRDGRIVAQCAPNTTDFATDKVENGMLLAVDEVAHEVKYATDSKLPIALNYTTEHMYDERNLGLKNFALNGKNDFWPRLGWLSVGDKFTTNCIGYDSAVDTGWTSDAAVMSAIDSALASGSFIYGGVSPKGAIKISATAPTFGPKLRLIKNYTMPNGTFGMKFQVYAD